MKQVGFFGGSFDPPHIAHVMACAYALCTFDLSELWVVPCYQHPFEKQMTDFQHRLAMCELAFGNLRRTKVSAVEQDLGGKSHTVRTLHYLQRLHPDVQFRLIVGSDILQDASAWNSFDEIERMARPIVIGRSGFEPDGSDASLLPRLSSTDVRQALQNNHMADVNRWVPRSVVEFVKKNRLYMPPANG